MYALLIHEIKLKSITLFNTFLLILKKLKLQLKQGLNYFKGLKRRSILYPIYYWIFLLD